MIEGWQTKIDEAQRETLADVGGVFYSRIRHIASADGSLDPCGDCAALPGQLHVSSCTRERCPRCRIAQRYGCDCWVQ
jgi:hypothetical protein